MFLILIWFYYHIIEYILLFIEEHSVLVGIVVSMVASLFWLKKYINEKRAEAFFGFYARLYLKLRTLQMQLEENGQLNYSDEKSGNIYSLIYTNDLIDQYCPSYKIPSDNHMELYQMTAEELINILLKTENNVYPRKTNKKEWYESECILLTFCEFIINNETHHSTNKLYYNNETEMKHIKKCKLLVKAINYILKSIENENY